MKSSLQPLRVLFLLLLIFSTYGCTGDQNKPGEAILAYQKALIGGDYGRLANLSCSDWENQAKTDFDSFAAVTATLEKASCLSSTIEENAATVTCTGKIVANYGNEVLEIDLSAQTYQAVREGGEWRMCGYR